MKNSLIFFLIYVLFIVSCTDRKRYINDLTSFQKQINSKFKDVTLSPLSSYDIQNFTSLDFFDFDSSYVVKAVLIPYTKDSIFDMKTNTDRTHTYNIFGKIKFNLNDSSFELNVYEDKELTNEQINIDELFLPFYDNTNGITTYSGGRYIDLKVTKDSIISVDFNKAYNPYCVYNYKFSCPIVPSENYIALEINAGVKDYNKN